ncbi:MAG: hypothetical protein M3277_00365 [Actinomycetota bacterium]|nr:hypothetical protein [Actinomycetota bacterium]
MMDAIRVLLHILFWYVFPLLALGLVVLTIVDGVRFLTRKIDSSRPDHWAIAISGICLNSIIVLGVGSIPLLDRDGLALDSDWWRGLGLVAILMLPALLAIVGLRRPGALLVAGVVSLPMPFMSFSFLLFPMLIPAALYLVAYGRITTRYTPRVPPAAVAGLTFLLIVLSFLSLFMNEDPRCYEIVKRPDGSTFERPLPSNETVGTISSGSSVVGSGCSSDSVTPIEAGLSLSLVALAVASATYLSGPRRPAHGVLDVYA